MATTFQGLCRYCGKEFSSLAYNAKTCRAIECKRMRCRDYRRKLWEKDSNAVKETVRTWRFKSRKNLLITSAKQRGKKFHLPFNLSIDDFEIPQLCPVLGIPMVFGSGRTVDGSPTLDRVIPSLGYVKGNVHIISHRANRLKSDATVKELKLVLNYLEQHLLK